MLGSLNTGKRHQWLLSCRVSAAAIKVRKVASPLRTAENGRCRIWLWISNSIQTEMLCWNKGMLKGGKVGLCPWCLPMRETPAGWRPQQYTNVTISGVNDRQLFLLSQRSQTPGIRNVFPLFSDCRVLFWYSPGDSHMCHVANGQWCGDWVSFMGNSMVVYDALPL